MHFLSNSFNLMLQPLYFFTGLDAVDRCCAGVSPSPPGGRETLPRPMHQSVHPTDLPGKGLQARHPIQFRLRLQCYETEKVQVERGRGQQRDFATEFRPEKSTPETGLEGRLGGERHVLLLLQGTGLAPE